MPFDENEIPFFDDAEPLRSEPRGFMPEQMVTCETCLRANPPTRTSCLYCAAQLEVASINADLVKPTLRKLEEWERGFNVVLLPEKTVGLSDAELGQLADLLRMEPEDLKRILETRKPMPVARAASQEEASLIETRLRAFAVEVTVISDVELIGGDSLPRRVRSFELSDTELRVRPSAGHVETWRAQWDEVVLMVAGHLFTRRLETEERKKRNAEGELVDARELSSDEPVLDIYFCKPDRAVRVSASNFDFSCLGSRKTLLAGQNFSTLITVLKEHARSAGYDDSYIQVRHALATAWPLEQHTEGRGWRRKGPGRVNIEAVTTSSNDLQFTRYSRLLDYLRVHGPEPSE